MYICMYIYIYRYAHQKKTYVRQKRPTYNKSGLHIVKRDLHTRPVLKTQFLGCHLIFRVFRTHSVST